VLNENRSRKVAFAALLIAAGVEISPFTFFPVRPSLVNPIQHAINVLAGILLGLIWGLLLLWQ
jgi:Predicted membrane protein